MPLTEENQESHDLLSATTLAILPTPTKAIATKHLEILPIPTRATTMTDQKAPPPPATPLLQMPPTPATPATPVVKICQLTQAVSETARDLDSEIHLRDRVTQTVDNLATDRIHDVLHDAANKYLTDSPLHTKLQAQLIQATTMNATLQQNVEQGNRTIA